MEFDDLLSVAAVFCGQVSEDFRGIRFDGKMRDGDLLCHHEASKKVGVWRVYCRGFLAGIGKKSKQKRRGG